jgi:hypothetical protein
MINTLLRRNNIFTHALYYAAGVLTEGGHSLLTVVALSTAPVGVDGNAVAGLEADNALAHSLNYAGDLMS